MDGEFLESLSRCAQPGEKLGEVDGLGEHRVGTEGRGLVDHGAVGAGEHGNADWKFLVADAPQDLHAVAIGEHEIENQGRWFVGEGFHAGGDGGDGFSFEAEHFKDTHEGVAAGGIVLYDEGAEAGMALRCTM